MFLNRQTTTYTNDCSRQIEHLKREIDAADAVVIGAGAGLSASAGFAYSGEKFDKYFADFKAKYGIQDMYSGGFFPFESMEEQWAWWSRIIFLNRYNETENKTYKTLFSLVKDKDYFVITTNVDHQFQLAGFDKKRLFYTQGDYGLWQCSKACHAKTYDNKDTVLQMVAQQADMKVPGELIPKCPVCGAPMMMNLRADDKFVEDEGWHAACERYENFIRAHKNAHVLYLELGVGSNTPVIIKYPFWRMTAQNKNAVYACINLGEAQCPPQIAKQSICIDSDIADALNELKKLESTK